MTKLQAMQQGYEFTGHYSHNRSEMTLRAKEERAKGNQAVVVTVPQDKLSRGYHGTGWSVYVIKSQANITQKIVQAKTDKINRLEYQKSQLMTEVAKIEDELIALRA